MTYWDNRAAGLLWLVLWRGPKKSSKADSSISPKRRPGTTWTRSRGHGTTQAKCFPPGKRATVAGHRHCLPATTRVCGVIFERHGAGGEHHHQWAGNRAVHPVRPMVLAISSPRSGVRG
jgi:hypothetical protein